MVKPTGTGKTVVFCHVAQRFIEHGRVLILAHREELIFQAAEKVERILGRKPAIEMAEFRSHEGPMFRKADVVVSSIQTQNAGRNGRRMSRFDPAEFSLVIVDEAHHVTADSYQRVLDHYLQNPNIKVLGCTATPDRHDEEVLGQIFDSVCFDYGILDAITDGWLVPIRQQFIHVEDLDFSAVRTTAGDLNGADLAAVMEEESAVHGIADPTFRLADGRRTLAFAASVVHAETLTEIFNRHKPESARIVTGRTPKDERRGMFSDYAEDRFQFLCNVGVATEGFDSPGIQVVSVARPTKSRALYAQCIGRGTRPLTGVVDGLPDAQARRRAIAASAKRGLTVLDFVGNSGRHKLITTAEILGGHYPDEVVERAKRTIARIGVAADVTAVLDDTARQEQAERKQRERLRRRHIVGKARYQASDVDPFGVLDIEPRREPGWHKGRKPSQKMVALLGKFGIDKADALSFHQAHELIDAGKLVSALSNKRRPSKSTDTTRRP